jgi:hypothetical protein
MYALIMIVAAVADHTEAPTPLDERADVFASA